MWDRFICPEVTFAASLATCSNALVTSSDALVTSSYALSYYIVAMDSGEMFCLVLAGADLGLIVGDIWVI